MEGKTDRDTRKTEDNKETIMSIQIKTKKQTKRLTEIRRDR